MNKPESIIISKLFTDFPEVAHGISTKLGGNHQPPFYNNMSFKVGDSELNVNSNREMFFGSLGIDQKLLAIPQQVHSDRIQIVNKAGFYPETDGLITPSKDLYLIISTADCYSVLIYDPVKKITAAVHSGWRGTQKKIVTKAIEMMNKEFACEPEEMIVFVGPGISRDNFEVGREVAEMFSDEFVYRRNGSIYVDLREHILNQLNYFGISKTGFYPGCTYNEKDYLHSFRRDREKSGRMFSVIGMRG